MTQTLDVDWIGCQCVSAVSWSDVGLTSKTERRPTGTRPEIYRVEGGGPQIWLMLDAVHHDDEHQHKHIDKRIRDKQSSPWSIFGMMIRMVMMSWRMWIKRMILPPMMLMLLMMMMTMPEAIKPRRPPLPLRQPSMTFDSISRASSVVSPDNLQIDTITVSSSERPFEMP